MHQLVQSAIEAAKCGDKNRAQGYLKQVLTANPNDVDAWLVLAAVLDDPEKKRQCLNRVLTVDPVSKIARQELLEMDRAAFRDMSAPSPRRLVVEAPQPRPEPVQPPVSQTPSPSVAATVQPQPEAKLGKTLIFTYPLWMKILTYAASGVFWLFTIASLCASPTAALIPGLLSLATLVSIWVVSARVEVSNEGVMSSRLVTGGAKVAWSEIAEIKSGATGQSLNLISKNGKKVSVNAQVGGYSEMIEILRRKRPDLFNGQPDTQSGATFQGSAFSGEKTFKRSAVSSVLGYAIGIVTLLFGFWAIFSNQNNSYNNWVIGLFIILIGLYLLGANLLAIQEIVVKSQQIAIVKNFGEEQLAQNQISEIKINTVRGRQGRVTHFVVIQRASGGSISVNGLAGGTEILYGTLMNWWQATN